MSWLTLLFGSIIFAQAIPIWKALDNTEVICHPLIVGELACGNLKNRKEILALLSALPMAPEVDYDEALEFIELSNLMGKGIGFIDVMLLASSRLAELPIWTNDKRLKDAAQGLRNSYIKKRS